MPVGSDDDIAVRVLGPVRLEVNGKAVRLGGQLRTMLAVLVTARGQPVSGTRLAELLWGEPTPASAGATLRSHVAHLRRATEPNRPAQYPPRFVVTEGLGYALRLGAERLDADRFERLLGQGRQALEAEDQAGASKLLAEALDLWCGDPLADVADKPFAVGEAARLRTLRETALRLRIDADLALGRHEELLGELRSLVATDPADERLRCRFALALHRSDQSEAAAQVCAEGLRLARERGLDAPALQALQTEVLRSSTAVPNRPNWVRRPPPFQVRADVAEFTGRVAELRALAGQLAACTEGPVAVAVHGKPGIGKSALAVRLAHRMASRFPDGVLYEDLRGAEPEVHRANPADVLGRFLRALGVPEGEIPPSVDAASAALRSVLVSRRVLIVLDNAADAAQVRPLLPASAGSAALITSRRPMADLDAVGSHSLELLTVDEAVTLLGRLAGPERIEADQQAARAVVDYCGLLPLAVRVAGARLRTRPCWTVATLAGRLADEQRRLAELTIGELGVQASFLLSYQDLAPFDQRLFRLLGLLDVADAGAEVAGALAGAPASAAERAMERLVDAQLLETHAAGRYRFHDLLRLFARRCAEACEGPAARGSAVGRAIAWYRERVAHAHEVLLPPADSDRSADVLAWLDLEQPNLVGVVRQAAGFDPPAAWALTDMLARYYVIRRRWSDWTAASRAALEVAESLGELVPQGVALRHLGTICSQQFRFAEATEHLQRALAVFRLAGDRYEEGQVLDKLGVVHGMSAQPAEAAAYCAAALAVARDLGDRRLESKALNNLGFAHCARDALDEAAGCVERSVAILREIGEHFELSTTLDSLGEIYLRQRRFTDALACFEEGIAIARDYGDRFDEAMALRGIGLVTRELRGAGPARSYFTRSLDILVELGAPQAEDVRRLLQAG